MDENTITALIEGKLDIEVDIKPLSTEDAMKILESNE